MCVVVTTEVLVVVPAGYIEGVVCLPRRAVTTEDESLPDFPDIGRFSLFCYDIHTHFYFKISSIIDCCSVADKKQSHPSLTTGENSQGKQTVLKFQWNPERHGNVARLSGSRLVLNAETKCRFRCLIKWKIINSNSLYCDLYVIIFTWNLKERSNLKKWKKNNNIFQLVLFLIPRPLNYPMMRWDFLIFSVNNQVTNKMLKALKVIFQSVSQH